jgi:ribonucleoside-diphosphate reductase beta chain
MSYLQDDAMKQRIGHVADIIDDPDDLVSLGGFSMVEGAILYSTFGFLKHYQSQGKNKLLNVVRGINYSVRDEHMHCIAGAACFKLKASAVSAEHLKRVEERLRETARQILEHEKVIIAKLFENGKIDGVTPLQLENFTMSRLNICLAQLGFSKEFNVEYDPISEWFYKGINDYQFNDFFAGQGREYHRNWSEDDFIWNKGE